MLILSGIPKHNRKERIGEAILRWLCKEKKTKKDNDPYTVWIISQGCLKQPLFFSEYLLEKELHMYSFCTKEKRKKILIVGDSHFFRNEFAKSCQEHGYEITSVGSEPEEISVGIRLCPEVVIVDYEMHHNDPYLVISILHNALPSSYIVLLNGRSQHCNEAEAKSAGAKEILSRSCDVSVFDEIIHSAEEEVYL